MHIEIRAYGTPQQERDFHAEISPILARIRASWSGFLVLRRIHDSDRRCRIVPYLGEFGANNAFARPFNRLGAGSFSRERRGGGSGSEVHFSPSTRLQNRVQWRNDEVLLHELCHSMRQVMGLQRYRRNATGGVGFVPMASFENIEEFFAAIVTSVYSSEHGRPALGNHGSWPLPDQERLRDRPFSTRLREIGERMPDFVTDMQEIPRTVAAFNPFRDILPDL